MQGALRAIEYCLVRTMTPELTIANRARKAQTHAHPRANRYLPSPLPTYPYPPSISICVYLPEVCRESVRPPSDLRRTAYGQGVYADFETA